MTQPQHTDTDETNRGATQITLPFIESGMRDPYLGMLLRDWLFLSPALVPIIAAVALNFATGNTSAFKLAFPASAVIAVLCWTTAQAIDWEFSHPVDKFTGYWRRLTSLRRFPLSHEEFVTDAEHGYARILDSGIGEMQDGRMVAFVRAPSRNTHRQTNSESNEMVLSLTAAIRRELDDTVQIWQTTFDSDPEDYLNQWREQRHSPRFSGDRWRNVRAYLGDLLDWEVSEERLWDPKERRTYLVVEVNPWEVREQSTADASSEGLAETVKSGISGSDGLTGYQRKQMERKLLARVDKVERVARRIAESDTNKDEIGMVGPGEHALLIAKYWRGVEPDFKGLEETDSVALSVWPDVGDYADASGSHRETPYRPVEVEGASDPLATASVSTAQVAGDGGETLTQSVKDSVDATDTPDGRVAAAYAGIRESLFGPHDSTRLGSSADINDSLIQERLAPSEYDVDGAYVTAGEQLCKTFWLAGWPKEPRSNFMESLQNMRGVDYDLVIRADSPNRRDAIHTLEEKIENTGASISERSQSHDPEAGVMSDEVDYYVSMYGMLKKTSARPWWCNAYLTVRVGNKRALEYAEEDSVDAFEQSTLSLPMAKRRALDEACEKILDVVEDEPMAMAPITSTERGDLLFESAFPASRDTYNEDTRKEKRALTLSGTLAATYLFSTANVQEPTGALYGRNVANGQKIVADQFARDGASHRLTGGRSGSGKTFFVGDQALQWWLAGGSTGGEEETQQR